MQGFPGIQSKIERRLSLFGCKRFSTNAAWGCCIPVIGFDDAADTTAELGCRRTCVCLEVFHAGSAEERGGVRKPVFCHTQGGRANLPGTYFVLRSRCAKLPPMEMLIKYGIRILSFPPHHRDRRVPEAYEVNKKR